MFSKDFIKGGSFFRFAENSHYLLGQKPFLCHFFLPNLISKANIFLDQFSGERSQTDNGAAGSVVASPNVLKGGATTTWITVDSTTPYTLTVKLYDIAGELILGRTVTGAPGTGTAQLNLSGLSSGLYLAVAELADSNGNFDGREVVRITFLK